MEREDLESADTAAPADVTAVSTGGATMAAPRGSASSAAIQHPNFTHERELARGGMGRVVVARDVRLERTVALKTLQADSELMRLRFEREAKITARLQHPGIVPIYESGTLANGEPFYAMRMVKGEPLDQKIAGTRDLRDRLGLLPSATAVAEALAYAHDQHVLHRDLKPANVLVGDFGETVVIDWGLAKDLSSPNESIAPTMASIPSVETDTGVTLDGEVMGTPSYMPPEQAAGVRVDQRADVYAIGALLYHVIAGRPPYRGSTMGEILAAVAKGPPVPLATLEPNVPPDLATIVERAMERDPGKRYPTAKELAVDLRTFVSGQLVASHRYSLGALIRRWTAKHRAAVIVACLLLAVVVIGVAVFFDQRDARERAVHQELARSRLELGRQLVVDGRAAEAAPYLRAALADLPDDGVARDLSARAAANLGRRVASFKGRAVALSPDGVLAAIGHRDGSIDVVVAATGASVWRAPPLPAHGAIDRLDLSRDGATIVATSRDGIVVRTASRTDSLVLGEWTDAKLVATGVAMTGPLGTRIVTREGNPLAMIADHGSPQGAAAPRALAVASDATTIAAVVADGSALVWAGKGSAALLRVPGHKIRGVRFDDDNRVLTVDDEATRRWTSSDTSVVLHAGLAPDVVGLDGDRVIVASDGFGAGAQLVGDGPPRDLAAETIFSAVARLSPTRFVTAGGDGAIRVWDVAHPRRALLSLDASSGVADITVAGTIAASIGLLDHTSNAETDIDLWDLGHLEVARPIATTPLPIARIAATADQHAALWLHKDSTNTVRILAGDRVLADVHGWPSGVLGSEVVVVVDGRVELYSFADGSHRRTVTDSADIYHVAWSPSGEHVVTSGPSTITFRDAAWRPIATIPQPDAPPIASLLITDDGRLVTGHEAGVLHIWSGTDPGPAIAAHSSDLSDLYLRGSTLFTSGYDLTLRAWSFPDGAPRGMISRFSSTVDFIAISPDGRRFVTASHRDAVDVWDTATGVLLATVPTSDDLLAVTFADDTHLVVGGTGGTLETVDLPNAGTATTADLTAALARSRWDLVDGRLMAR